MYVYTPCPHTLCITYLKYWDDKLGSFVNREYLPEPITCYEDKASKVESKIAIVSSTVQTTNYIVVGEDELFVTEDHHYTVLNTQGQRVLTIGSKRKPPFGDEYPIATDGDGSVYIATEDHKVQKFSRCGVVNWSRQLGRGG